MAEVAVKESFYVSEADGSMCRLNSDGTVTTFDECEVADLLNKSRSAVLAEYEERLAELIAGRYQTGGRSEIDYQNEIERLREKLCKCDMRTRLNGDGCQYCNPEMARRIALEEQKGEIDG